jgi:hypothetical protein
MSHQSNIIDRSGNLDQTRAVPFLTAVSGLVGKIGDEPMVRKWRSRASRQVLIGDQLKTAKALGSEVPPMLLGRDNNRCLLAILELLVMVGCGSRAVILAVSKTSRLCLRQKTSARPARLVAMVESRMGVVACINNPERDTTVQCFAMNASTVSLKACGFSTSI